LQNVTQMLPMPRADISELSGIHCPSNAAIDEVGTAIPSDTGSGNKITKTQQTCLCPGAHLKPLSAIPQIPAMMALQDYGSRALRATM